MAKFKIGKLPCPVIITEIKLKTGGCLVVKGLETVDVEASEAKFLDEYLGKKVSSVEEKSQQTQNLNPEEEKTPLEEESKSDDFSDVLKTEQAPEKNQKTTKKDK